MWYIYIMLGFMLLDLVMTPFLDRAYNFELSTFMSAIWPVTLVICIFELVRTLWSMYGRSN
jgi:hypothetical protein